MLKSAAIVLLTGILAFGALATELRGQARVAGATQASPAVEAESRTWLSFGLGLGSARLDCGGCGELVADDPWRGGTGVAGHLGGGWVLNPRLRLGGELNLWARRSSAQRRDATLFLFSLNGLYSPLGAEGPYVDGGAGAGLSILAGGGGLVEGSAAGAVLRVGYRFRATGRYALAPYLGYVQLIGDGATGSNQGAEVVGPSSPGWFHLGLGISRF